VPAKHTGKKHGKGIVKPSDGFVSVAYDRVPGFTNRKDRRGARDPPAGSFHSLPHKCVNALFAADWVDNRRRFDGELIVLHVHKALLISSLKTAAAIQAVPSVTDASIALVLGPFRAINSSLH
jgi:hypothetical protein